MGTLIVSLPYGRESDSNCHLNEESERPTLSCGVHRRREADDGGDVGVFHYDQATSKR